MKTENFFMSQKFKTYVSLKNVALSVMGLVVTQSKPRLPLSHL